MKRLILTAVFGALILGTATSTAMATPCVVGSNVLVASFSCSVGPLTFSNFSSNTDSTLGIDIGAILSDGLQFNPNLPTNGMPVMNDITFQFEVSGGVLGEILSVSGNAGANVQENICTTQQVLGKCLGTDLGDPTATGTGPVVTVSFAYSNPVWIFKDINDGGGALSVVNQNFIVPEPMTLSLMGAGLLGLGFLRRFKK